LASGLRFLRFRKRRRDDGERGTTADNVCIRRAVCEATAGSGAAGGGALQRLLRAAVDELPGTEDQIARTPGRHQPGNDAACSYGATARQRIEAARGTGCFRFGSMPERTP